MGAGDVYTGGWVDDMRHGSGVCKYANGDTFVGSFAHNLRHGAGVYTAAPIRMLSAGGDVTDLAGDLYTGAWQADKKHGYGRYVWSDGDVYEGTWEEDVRSQQGTCVYANGDRYTGEWRGDKRHGIGRLAWSDGNTYEGLWADDNIAPGAARAGSRAPSLQASSRQPSPAHSHPSSRAGSRGPSAEPSPLHSPKGGPAPPLGHVPNLQDESPGEPGGGGGGDFDLARAAGELAETWFDTLTGGRPSPARREPYRGTLNGPANSARAQLHMF